MPLHDPYAVQWYWQRRLACMRYELELGHRLHEQDLVWLKEESSGHGKTELEMIQAVPEIRNAQDIAELIIK